MIVNFIIEYFNAALQGLANGIIVVGAVVWLIDNRAKARALRRMVKAQGRAMAQMSARPPGQYHPPAQQG